MESIEQQMKDSDMIFNQIKNAEFPSLDEARTAIALLYIPDMSISRAGISHALKRVEDLYTPEGG